MSYEEFRKKLLEIGIDGINHFECEKCHNITPAYSLGRDYKPILKGLCEECAKQEFKQKMIEKRERNPDCEYWMHIIEHPETLKRMRKEEEDKINGIPYKCPNCGTECETPLCKTCHEKLLEKLEKQEHEWLIEALNRIKKYEEQKK